MPSGEDSLALALALCLTDAACLCIAPLAGLVAPFLIGDGGRSAEEASTSYSYRIKHVYPKGGGGS